MGHTSCFIEIVLFFKKKKREGALRLSWCLGGSRDGNCSHRWDVRVQSQIFNFLHSCEAANGTNKTYKTTSFLFTKSCPQVVIYRFNPMNGFQSSCFLFLAFLTDIWRKIVKYCRIKIVINQPSVTRCTSFTWCLQSLMFLIDLSPFPTFFLYFN